MGNSNRFKLSDSLVDAPQLVDAGSAVGRASATDYAPRLPLSSLVLRDGHPIPFVKELGER